MHQLRKGLLFKLVLLFSLFLTGIKADCNVCNVATGNACISQTEYQSCQNALPSGNKYACNTDQFCTVSGKCESSTVAPIDCDQCNKCSETNTFACTGTQTFSLCLGTNTPSIIIGTCSDNLVCSINNPNICGESSTNPATCSYKDDPAPITTIPPPSAELNPKAYCQYMNQEGRFPVGTNLDTTCKQYVHCLQYNGAWISAVYYCPGGTYFDSTSKTCITSAPARCSPGISSLTLYDLQLI